MRHLHPCTRSTRQLRKRRLLVEALESRLLLDAEGLAWSAPNLTISFAPDGTSVAGYESTLFQSLDATGDSSVWQDAILRGFETWAQHTAASISTTADSGHAFGTPGPTQGDSRFGDVRVAAVPMADDVIAMSIPHDEVISGTWAGDLLFNSNADLNNIDDIFAIAVHEAGHVFGLGHSTDPNSPMYLHGITAAVTPTGADINNLQRLYGVPTVGGGSDGGEDHEPIESEHEREHREDELIAANSVMLSANFQDAIRYDAAGQIFEATDVDFYQLAPIDDKFEHADVLTVTVRSTTPEGLIPTVIIRDEEGEVAESTVLANANGEFILQVRDADPRKAHFIEVQAADKAGSHATGTYNFVATFRTRDVVLNRIAKGTLKPEHPTRSSALHVSETRLVHFVLATEPVESSTQSVAWMVIYDAHGSPVFRTAARPGESRSANTVLLTPGDYEIEFRTDVPDGTDSVEIDYRLLARSISLPIGPDPIDPTQVPILPCSDPGSDPVYCYPLEVGVIDPFILPDPTLITFPEPVILITPPSLDSGLWYWEGVSPPSDLPAPIGTSPPLTAGSSKLIQVPPTSPLTPNPLSPLSSSPVTPPGPGNSAGESNLSDLISPIAGWLNITLPEDVNADKRVSPIDALLVVNFLNASGPQLLSSEHPSGSPFLDVNSDGFASPVDALLVVNELNRPSRVAAEGESVQPTVRFSWLLANAMPAAALPFRPQQNWNATPSTIADSKNEVAQEPLHAPNSIATAGSGNFTTRPAATPPADMQTLEEAISQIATDLSLLK